MKVLALIPARGGSKGIPRKNILPIAGKPVIAYSIAQARASKRVDRVVVSTDDAEIAEIAAAHGAEVPFRRPAEFARDDSPDIDVFLHALRHLRDHEGYRCDYVVHLRPPTVLRRTEDIDRAIDLLAADPEADSLRSVSPAALTPYKMWRGRGPYIEPVLSSPDGRELHSMPRQLLPQVFWQNGYVDVIRSRVILAGSMCGSRVMPFVVRHEVAELDYREDVEALERHLANADANLEPDDPGTAIERHAR